MNLQERKANIERTVAQIKQEIEGTIARRESLLGHMNALLGQIHLINQLLEEEVPPPSEDLVPDPVPEIPSDSELVAGEEHTLET